MGDIFAVIHHRRKFECFFKQIVNKKSQPKNICNAAYEEVPLNGGSRFPMVSDNNPVHHRTVAPVEYEFIGCVACTIGGRLGVEPTPATNFVSFARL